MTWFKKVWPISALKRRYDTFVARLETEVIFKASSALEESFASARDEALHNLERSSASARKELEDTTTELKRTVYDKAGELRKGLKETKTSADAATATVRDLSSRLDKVEGEYEDIKTRNDQNKEVIGRAAATLAGARAALETAEKKHMLALSAAEGARKAYEEALSRANDVRGSLERLSDLQGRAENALAELKNYHESLDSDFAQKRGALFSEFLEKGSNEVMLRARATYFLGMSPEQKELLAEFAVYFNYDEGKRKEFIEALRKGTRGNSLGSLGRVVGVQNRYLNNKFIEQLVTRARSEKMQLKDFAKEGVDILLEQDQDFTSQYKSFERDLHQIEKKAEQRPHK